MRNFLRSSALVLFAVFITALACVWILSRHYVKQQRDFGSDEALQYAGLGRNLVLRESDRFGDRLSKLIEQQFFQTPEELAQEVRFEGVALLTQLADGWNISWSRFKEDNLKSEIQMQMSKWPLEGVGARETRWAQIRTTSGALYHLIIVDIESGSGRQQRGVGILPQTALGSLVASFKSKDDKIFVIDGAGLSYAYPEPQYVGAKFDTHSMVSHVVRTSSVSYSGVFKDFSGQSVIGAYARVPDTNLYVAYTKPYLAVPKLIQKFSIQAGVVVIGLALMFSIFAHMIRSGEWQRQQVLEQNLQLARGQAKNREIKVETKVVEDTVRSQHNRAIVRIVEQPLLAALGFLHMLSSEIKSAAARERYAKLERELRKIKEFVGDVAQFEKVATHEIEIISLEEVLQQLMISFRKEMSVQKIAIEENIKANVFTKASFQEVKESVRTTIMFLLEKFKKDALLRKIIINLEKVGGVGRIVIEAKGIGISKEEAQYIFKPYSQKTKCHGLGGLDLALAKSNTELFHGDLQFETIGVDGARFIYTFPRSEMIKENESPAAPVIKKENRNNQIDEALSVKVMKESESSLLPPPPTDTSPEIEVREEISFTKSALPVVEAPGAKGAIVTPDEVGTKSISGVFIRKPKVRAKL